MAETRVCTKCGKEKPVACSVITPQVVNRAIVQFLQGTDVAGTYKTLYTAGANGSRCVALQSTNTDGSATQVLDVFLRRDERGLQPGAAGSGTVNAGLTGQVAFYPGNASTVGPENFVSRRIGRR